MGEGRRVCPISQRMTLRHSNWERFKKISSLESIFFDVLRKCQQRTLSPVVRLFRNVVCLVLLWQKKRSTVKQYRILLCNTVTFCRVFSFLYITSLCMCSDSVTILTTGIPNSLYERGSNEWWMNEWWFSHDVTKIQTIKLSILLRFYFHGVLEQLKTNFQANFRFKRVLGFVIE